MNKRSIITLFALGAIWGASFLFIKIGVAEMGPFTLAMLRVFIGSIGLLAAIWATGTHIPTTLTFWRHLAVMGVIGISVPFAAISWGTQFIPSGLSAILNASMPLFTAVLAALWGDEHLSLRRIAGVIVGMVGILALTLPKLQGDTLGEIVRAGLLGELAVVFAALSYAVAVVYGRHHLAGQPPLVNSFGQVSMGWVFLLPLSLTERPWAVEPSTSSLLAVLALGLLGTSLAYILYHRLLQTAGATGTSLVTYIVPVFGVFWGWAILGERMTSAALLALGLILGGVLLVAGPKRQGVLRVASR